MAFRTRSFVAVPPAERTVKRRRAARLILRAEGRVLLLRDSDPGAPGVTWWQTPGGGIEPGELDATAAIRELEEETGLRLTEDALIGPIATRTVLHGFSDQITIQDEVFYAVDVAPFEPDTSGFTADEKLSIEGFSWFGAAEVPEPVWPTDIARLMAADGSQVIDYGVVEESSVPLLPSQRGLAG